MNTDKDSSNLFSLKSKIAVVTGAARGNGYAISEGLRKYGAQVIGLDRMSHPELIESKKCIKCDVTSTKDVAECLKEYPRIDILVNNAGVSTPRPFLSYPEDIWDETYEVNLKAPFKLMQYVANAMKDSGGSIINITSLNAELGFPDNPAYLATKGGLKQLTKSAAMDLGKYNIRVNNVGPGYIATEMTRPSWEDEEKRKARTEHTILKRWGQPEDLVGVCVFLASEASAYITGQDIYVDGGWSIKGL